MLNLRDNLLKIPIVKTYAQRMLLGCTLAQRIDKKCTTKKGRYKFAIKNYARLYVQSECKSKSKQIGKLLRRVDILPADSKYFLYSVDYYKSLHNDLGPLYNTTVDYEKIVKGNFNDLKHILSEKDSTVSNEWIGLIDSMNFWVARCQRDKKISQAFEKPLAAIQSLFEREALTFFEALQRILFYNQFLWQMGHKHNGLGRLDLLLYDLYRNDITSGRMTEAEAEDFLKDFFKTLHENYRLKSVSLLGDTGQIIILGGLSEDGTYCFNELTYKFIKIAQELRLPEPKVLLRCSRAMPDDLMKSALSCIATGIGGPLLSNDDAVIPALTSFGYEKADACRYVTAACWEPLTVGGSCDGANLGSLNFAVPLVDLLNQEETAKIDSWDFLVTQYLKSLLSYVDATLKAFSSFQFEESPLISLLSDSALASGKDITRGGHKYFNIGLTSVGLGTVVNSLLNINRLVLSSSKYTFSQLNQWRKENFCGHEEIVRELKALPYGYGSDNAEVLSLTRRIMDTVDKAFSEYQTITGGKFRFGLSSPGYISDAYRLEATLDGRKNGDPFNVHISSQNAIAPTELLSFASSLNYSGSCINGNVVDFFVTPSALRSNLDKYVALFKASFQKGVYQCQMNVVESKTLIEAKKNPELFPNLVVRVWGFSAYFNELPEEYKDLLIRRAIESEKVA